MFAVFCAWHPLSHLVTYLLLLRVPCFILRSVLDCTGVCAVECVCLGGGWLSIWMCGWNGSWHIKTQRLAFSCSDWRKPWNSLTIMAFTRRYRALAKVLNVTVTHFVQCRYFVTLTHRLYCFVWNTYESNFTHFVKTVLHRFLYSAVEARVYVCTFKTEKAYMLQKQKCLETHFVHTMRIRCMKRTWT